LVLSKIFAADREARSGCKRCNKFLFGHKEHTSVDAQPGMINMKDKNHDLDCWISGIRAPYERVFSKIEKRVRYKGIVKNFFCRDAFYHLYQFRSAIC
jgi:hypothetical protein